MKNLRKVLAMVLVVALAFSLVTFASAAKLTDYKDASSVKQKEAVDILSQAGVLAGADGSFNPTDNFTREQAAKVITYLMLGTKVADSLQTTTSSFSDVAVSRWSAPYIQYCVTTGVLNGMGDGTFAPEGKVTGTQFAKMLLTALGYGKNGEYVGANWEINTLKDAASLEILDLDVNYTAPATREQVAQYALNALVLSAVVWDKTTDEYVVKNLNSTNYFANKLNLVRTADVVGGVSGYTWTLNGNNIGFYGDESLIASDATGLKISQMTDKYGTWAMFFKAEMETGVKFYFNGAAIHVYNATNDAATTYSAGDLLVYNNLVYKVLATATGAQVIADIPNIAAYTNTKVDEYNVRGAVVNFISTDKDIKAETVSIIQKTVVIADGAPSVSFGNVKIPGMTFGTGVYQINENMIKYPADIKADDYLLYYKDLSTGIFHVEKAQVVTGTATSSSISFGVYSYNISGTARKGSQLAGSLDSTLNTTMSGLYNVELSVVIDNGGNIIDVDAATNSASTAKYAVVLDTANQSAAFSSGVVAQLLFTDGTVKVATIAKVDSLKATLSAAAAYEQKFVTYTVADNGEYSIKGISSALTVSPAGSVDINRAANFVAGNTVIGDAETVFITLNTATTTITDDYVALKGITNAPDTASNTATGVQIVKFTATGPAKYVYLPTVGTLTTPTLEKVAYVIYDGLFVNYTIIPAKDDQPMYYEYKAIVDGQATTIKSVKLFMNTTTYAAEVGLKALTYNDDGYVTNYANATGATVGTGSEAAANGIVKLGGLAYTYDANTAVYYIDTFGTVTKKTVADIRRDNDDIVTAYLTQSTTDAADMLGAIYITVK